MATRPEQNGELKARASQKQKPEDAKQNYEHSAPKSPDHQYGYGGFREDLLYENSEEQGSKADESKGG